MIRKAQAFTLIELLVVISIIALLSGIVLASLNSARSKARDTQRKNDLHQLDLVNNLYYHNEGNGSYIYYTGWLYNAVQFGGTQTQFNPVIPKYIPYLPNDPQYPGGSSGASYIYLWKDWPTCVVNGFVSDSKRYAFYARLENPTAADLLSLSDQFDQCVKTNYGMNYKVGN